MKFRCMFCLQLLNEEEISTHKCDECKEFLRGMGDKVE